MNGTIGMPEALAIMSLSGIVIAAIINRKNPQPAPQPETSQPISQGSCTNCRAEIMKKFEEKRADEQKIFDELKEHGKQLARIEQCLEGIKT